jgi:hypothetical protein
MDVLEVCGFTQEDLIDDDVMILDTYNTVYVWIGTQANEQEKREAHPVAHNFIRSMSEQDGRDTETPIISFSAGREPADFKSYFLAWDEDYMKKKIFLDPYEAKLQKLKAEKASKMDTETEEVKSSTPTPPPPESFKPPSNDGVDPAKREFYLSDKEFQETFNMSKDEFYQLKKWRQVELKKKNGLF